MDTFNSIHSEKSTTNYSIVNQNVKSTNSKKIQKNETIGKYGREFTGPVVSGTTE